MNDNTIFEREDSDKIPYFQAHAYAFQNDSGLSLQAKGLLAMLLSFGHGWKIYMRDIEKRSASGRDTLRSAVKELVKCGYLSQSRVQGERGRFTGWKYKVSQTPNKMTISRKNHKVDRKTVLPISVAPTDGITDIGKTVNDKYKQQTNNSNVNNKQQQGVVAQIYYFSEDELKQTESLLWGHRDHPKIAISWDTFTRDILPKIDTGETTLTEYVKLNLAGIDKNARNPSGAARRSLEQNWAGAGLPKTEYQLQKEKERLAKAAAEEAYIEQEKQKEELKSAKVEQIINSVGGVEAMTEKLLGSAVFVNQNTFLADRLRSAKSPLKESVVFAAVETLINEPMLKSVIYKE